MKKIFRIISFFILEIVDKRMIIFVLAKREFQSTYMGSYLGFMWAFLQPLMFIAVLNLVFTLGIRHGNDSSDIPFVLYLTIGLLVWMYFSENLSSGTRAIKEYSYLIKKIDFRLAILPIIKLLSSAVTHLLLVIVAILIAGFNGYMPGLYLIQLIYYMASMMLLLLGISWITSSTSIFIKDVGNVVSIIVKFGFWLTPIFWNIDRVPVNYQWIVKLNPVYYIVSGYRDSIVLQVPFWEHPIETAYYWSFTLICIGIGIFVFRKLRPHFAEVI